MEEHVLNSLTDIHVHVYQALQDPIVEYEYHHVKAFLVETVEHVKI